MERFWKPAVVAATLFLALGAATNDRPPQTEFERDVIARLERIERLASSGTRASEQVRTATDFACNPGSDCNQKASRICEDSGFSHGVASRTVAISSSGGTHRATEVTCF